MNDRKFDICSLRENFIHERRNGDTYKAYEIIQSITGLPEADVRDSFAAGECAIRLNRFSDAVEHLSKVISIEEGSDDKYYLDQSYFWRAYSLIKMNRFSQAATDIELIKHIESTFYVYSVIPEKSVSEITVGDLIDSIRPNG